MQVNYLKSFSSSLLSLVAYRLDQAKEYSQRKLIQVKQELDYRPSQAVLQFRKQQLIRQRVSDRWLMSRVNQRPKKG